MAGQWGIQAEGVPLSSLAVTLTLARGLMFGIRMDPHALAERVDRVTPGDPKLLTEGGAV